MSIPPWIAKQGVPEEQHLRDLSEYIARHLPKLAAHVAGIGQGQASSVVVNQTTNPPPEDVISEAQVEFDDAAGHDHSGTGSSGTPISLAGDVTGDNTATLVEQVQGVPFPAPAAGDDGKAVVYDHAPSPTFAYASLLTTAALSLQVVDGFYADAVGASVTAQALSRNAAAGPQAFLPVRAGSITGIAVYSDDPTTAGTLTVEVYKNGVATGLTAVLNTTDPTFKATTQAAGLDTFAAGDRIDIRYTTNGAFLPITANIIASFEIALAIQP